MATEKKETKAKVEETLDNTKQKRIKSFSQLIYIFAKIIKVFTIIGGVCLIIAMAIVPVLVKNIKVEDGTLNVFDSKLEYRLDDKNQNILSIDGIEIGSISNEEKVGFDYIMSELAKTNVTKIFAFVEISIIFGIAIMVVYYLILDNIYKLFSNIYNDETPFTMNSLNYVNKIAYYGLIYVIVSFVSDILSNILFNVSVTNISLTKIAVVLVLYIVSYVYEYACILQNKSKLKLYN